MSKHIVLHLFLSRSTTYAQSIWSGWVEIRLWPLDFWCENELCKQGRNLYDTILTMSLLSWYLRHPSPRSRSLQAIDWKSNHHSLNCQRGEMDPVNTQVKVRLDDHLSRVWSFWWTCLYRWWLDHSRVSKSNMQFKRLGATLYFVGPDECGEVQSSKNTEPLWLSRSYWRWSMLWCSSVQHECHDMNLFSKSNPPSFACIWHKNAKWSLKDTAILMHPAPVTVMWRLLTTFRSS